MFMLVYSSEVKNPSTKTCVAMNQTDVAVPMVANRMISKPSIRVFESSTSAGRCAQLALLGLACTLI